MCCACPNHNYQEKELGVRRDRPNNSLSISVQFFIAEKKIGPFM